VQGDNKISRVQSPLNTGYFVSPVHRPLARERQWTEQEGVDLKLKKGLSWNRYRKSWKNLAMRANPRPSQGYTRPYQGTIAAVWWQIVSKLPLLLFYEDEKDEQIPKLDKSLVALDGDSAVLQWLDAPCNSAGYAAEHRS
jgi:hypothetical protein